MKLSIIIPTLNEEKYITDAINQFKVLSVEHEIIVSDGNSTDATMQIAKELANKVVVYSGTKRSPGAQRNDGAKQASGEIILFIDADTRLLETEKFVISALSRLDKDPGLKAIAFKQCVLPEIETLSDRIVFGLDNVIMRFRNNVLKSGWACGKCMLVRRTSFEEVRGFNEDLIFGEDFDLYQRIARVGSTRYAPSLAYYHHARRLHRLGIIRFWWTWIVNGASVLFLKKAQVDEWTPVR